MTDWTDKLSSKERVQATVELLSEPATPEEIADEADVSLSETREIIRSLVKDGIAKRVGDKVDVNINELARRMSEDDFEE
ncbi:hypothetical protein EXE49_07995 [Halorubrum sp. ASP121]|uniref:DUF7342 family protein n=1 Tax=Halorubrum sp. ASP121 TaxID=1855858 RepID=UPI0010F6DA5B|nr:hypothetical protein [Halorubrum sp. ASP121]TKX50102.1 hypothetical protein EXE49_07995 [Halorubrum sp. ASP121]